MYMHTVRIIIYTRLSRHTFYEDLVLNLL